MNKYKYMKCYKCGENYTDLIQLFGYYICNDCVSSLKLLQNDTIKRHIVSREKAKEINSDSLNFSDEVQHKLFCLERDFKSKKIKLMYILNKIDVLKKE